jgi:GrpB-like predicted nucleotidyltransferase (UPF0157 family)
MWTRTAEALSDGLTKLGPLLLCVHHIGSTAVPGLCAKPVIDLMPIVTSLDQLDGERRLVEQLGFEWHGELGIEGRRYCTLTSHDGTRVAQLHIFSVGSSHVDRHLAFRDYLRTHPESAAAYTTEKRRARALHPDDSHAYADEKAKWIRIEEAKAMAWFAGTRVIEGAKEK